MMSGKRPAKVVTECQQNGTEARHSCFPHGDGQALFLLAFSVDKVHQNETVVNDHTRQSYYPEKGENRKVDSHDDMPGDGTDQTEGNRAHDKERLAIGA